MTQQSRPRVRLRSRQGQAANRSLRLGKSASVAAGVLLVVLFVVALVALFRTGRLSLPATLPPLTRNPLHERIEQLGLPPTDGSAVEATDIRMGDSTYQVVSYSSGGTPQLHILLNDQVVADPETAYAVLLTYAWQPDYSQVQKGDAASLRALARQLTALDDTYRPLFVMAHAAKPVLEVVDNLQAYPIHGVPTLEVGGFVIVDVQNAWDALCIIPIDAADLCMLEPLLRAYYKEAVDVEQRMASAAAELEQLTDALDAVLAGGPYDGTAVKVLAQETASSLDALARKLDGFGTQAHNLGGHVRTAADVIANRRWGAGVQSTLALLHQLIPGFNETALLNPLVAQLRKLDTALQQGEQSAQQGAADLRARQAIIERILAAVNAKVQSAGSEWVFPTTIEE